MRRKVLSKRWIFESTTEVREEKKQIEKKNGELNCDVWIERN